MFARNRRLRKSEDIITAIRKGRRCAAGAVTCSFISRPATLGRATVVVNTKVSKKAVERNLLKRRIRSLLYQSNLPAGDLVVQVRPGALTQSFAQLTNDLQKCLSTLG